MPTNPTKKFLVGLVGIPYSPSTGPSGIGGGTGVKRYGAGCGGTVPHGFCPRTGGTTGAA